VIEIETPHGPAHAHVQRRRAARGSVVLGHGAGGGVEAPDLLAAAHAAADAGWTVVRVEQPYRVAGRRAPAPAAQLDASWIAVVQALRLRPPLVVGGRSSGARVACRTAAGVGAAGVLCLAFPLHPPGKPEQSRLDELDGVPVPTLVVQGERDPFGLPPPGRRREVVVVRGDHGLKADLPAVEAAVRAWLSAEPPILRLPGGGTTGTWIPRHTTR
jgi:predicted alpha/beta-hydrolase family hydrolase